MLEVDPLLVFVYQKYWKPYEQCAPALFSAINKLKCIENFNILYIFKHFFFLLKRKLYAT